MILKPKIFRSYDIRGQAFVDFDEDGFFVIGAAFGKYIAEKFKLDRPRIFVSGDGRTSMPQLWPAVVSGLEASNSEIVWGGTLPTPINYFAFHEGGFDGAIQITASHNPPQDNGLKLTDRHGAVCGEEIQKLRALAACGACRRTEDLGACVEGCQVVEFRDQYIQKLKQVVGDQHAKKIVIDAGNGVGGLFYPDVFRAFGHEVVELYCDLDATFPNHQPDPERRENMVDLTKKVIETKADFGFGFDGDGDRVGIILGDGTLLLADHILYVLAADYLSRHPGACVVVDAMSSATLINNIRQLGGEVVLSKTGHSYIEETMKEVGADFAGEQSGHFMFGENFYGHDDAALASLRFLSAVASNPSWLDEVTDLWPKMVEYSERLSVDDEEKFSLFEAFKAKAEASFADAKLNTLDGLRFDWGDGEWAIVRCSNTSPKIALRIEARDEGSLDKKRERLLGILQEVGAV